MADLRRGSRGQLLIITALGLAVLLILMALALNTAVLGEVHADRTDDGIQEERRAIQYEDSAERGIEDLILPVNDRTAPEYDTRRNELDQEVTTWSDATATVYADDGVVTSVSLEDTTFETDVVHDDESRKFTNADTNNDSDWTVAEDLENADTYEINVTDDQAVAPGDCFGKDICFNITVTGSGGSTWVLSIFSKDAGNISVKVAGGNGGDFSSPALIDVKNGTVNDDPVFTSFFDDPDVDPPYRVRYSNADNASGTYRIIEIVGDDPVVEENFYDTGSGKSPRLAPRIVAATVRVEYRSSTLTYQNETRIVPGDDDG